MKIDCKFSRYFDVSNGLIQVKQKFNLVLELSVRSMRTVPGGTIINRLKKDMAYEDDIITGRTLTSLSNAFQEFKEIASELGLDVNTEKTKYIKSFRRDR